MLASKRYGTLYVGVTSDLVKRIWEHKQHLVAGFTHTHGITQLVWYEIHDAIEAAIVREKQLKKWRRDWKVNLIQQSNPHWRDLYAGIVA
jgi:putative endonuclease